MNDAREAKLRAEMATGRRRTMINMAEGLVAQLAHEVGYNEVSGWELDTASEDNREWAVTVKLPGGHRHTENFWVFPSDELKTTIMLMRGH